MLILLAVVLIAVGLNVLMALPYFSTDEWEDEWLGQDEEGEI